MPTKVKVSFPLDEKTITVERDVEEAAETVTGAIIRLLSDIAAISKTEQSVPGRKIAEESVKTEPEAKSVKWVYQTEQPSAKFAERYAKLMEEEEEEAAAEQEKQDGTKE
jgi:hypothetical protein